MEKLLWGHQLNWDVHIGAVIIIIIVPAMSRVTSTTMYLKRASSSVDSLCNRVTDDISVDVCLDSVRYIALSVY